MGLKKYHAKRNFKKTSEPSGKEKPAKKTKKLKFVIQKHAATALHYDFRLELDGVLISWAVPKGPSLSPHDRHLAIHVEDHPMEYRKFEGVIPEGEYGAGEVIIWDEGTYEPYDGGDNPQEKMRQELKTGHITIIMHGKKLKGEYALIKLKDSKKEWLLIKKGDEFASESKDILKQDQSIKSGKTIEDLKEHGDPPDVSRYSNKKSPWHVKPMLSTLAEESFSDSDWIFEVKWDGYRAIASKYKNKIELYSRNDLDFTKDYPEIAKAMHEINHDVILDGEIVVLDDEGVPHFEWMQNWRHQNEGHLFYYAFDILWYDGKDVRDMPLIERKELLRSVLPKDSTLRFGDYIKDGENLFNEMKSRHMEGIMAKVAASEYKEGIRGKDWLKIKTHQRQEVVIGGFTEPRGSRSYLGALIVGVYDGNDLTYVGHSGGGIADKKRKKLRETLNKIERKTSPFKKEPKPNAPVHWVKPELVCEMSFTEWTSEGHMRHPKFEGMREDKDPKLIKRELVKKIEPKREAKKMENQKFEFTHLDKVFFPKHKYTKGDIVEYYKSVSSYILPYLKDRPISMLRQPDGIDGMSFFQKNNEHLPSWVPHADIYSESNQKDLHWIVGSDLDTLLYMVQLGCIEINPWNSRVGKLDKPDWLVIDLDPEGVRFAKVIKVAKTVKEVCDEWKIKSYPKTSGKTGIHIYIPLDAKYDYDQAKNFAHLLAMEVNKRQPKITSLERLPKKREHKIYLDFLQNRPGQTLAAPYSVRPTPEASVSTPLDWGEIDESLKPSDFTIKNIQERLEKIGDLWKPVIGKGINLKKILQQIS